MAATAGYSGTPLVRKLGIKSGMRVALVSAPSDFRRLLVGLPGDVRLSDRAAGSPDLGVWFVTRRRELDRRIEALAGCLGHALWIAWPKKTSGVETDLTEDVVRNVGLARGLVDYKVCAIDATWSGLKFARRRPLR